MSLDPLDHLEQELAEHDALVHVRHCAALVLAFHDGPRDDHFERASETAWNLLREALSSG